MKKSSLILLASVIFFSCQTSKKYTITGTIADPAYEGTEVFIMSKEAGSSKNSSNYTSLDTAVVEEGKFVFTGEVDTPQLRYIAIYGNIDAKSDLNYYPILLESGNFNCSYDDSAFTIEGSAANEAYTTYMADTKKASEEIERLYKQYEQAQKNDEPLEPIVEAINKAYGEYSDRMTNLNYDFAKTNMTNQLGQLVFQNNTSLFSTEQQRELLDLAGDEYKSTDEAKKIITNLEIAERSAIGQPFVDITLPDSEGNDISLSDYAGKGKYVLIDFWASWCGPCRQEMPTLVEAYKKYRDKGFEIVGVSLDKEHEDWIGGIKTLGITWPQMSDLKMWDTEARSLYAFDGIPHTILLDQDGIIIYKDLRGEALLDKLAELMP